jgi:hypothetical protein
MGEKLNGVTNHLYVIGSCGRFVTLWLGVSVPQSHFMFWVFFPMDLVHLFQIINKKGEDPWK